MAGRWTDDRDWRDREAQRRYDDRYDVFGLNDEGDRYAGREDRSFDRDERVFGERESGVGYNRPQRGAYGGRSDGPGWQDEHYGGVSPAMRRGDYETGYRAHPRFRTQDYTRGDYDRGGRYYGDDGRTRLYGGEYDYGASHRPYDGEGRRFGSYSADRRWEREMRREPGRVYSGGTGGYDYERGYGDGGREYDARDRGDLEDRAREAGEFFRRTGRKISNWFADVAGEGGYGEDRQRYEEFRGARGRGPKGYQRSDDRISDEAHQRLTDDAWLDATEINVSVSGGEVTLSGTVDSREAKHRAERIVEDVSGVKHVQNNLRVTAGNYFTTAGRGYGDSVQEARMASSEQVKDVTDGNATPPAQKRN